MPSRVKNRASIILLVLGSILALPAWDTRAPEGLSLSPSAARPNIIFILTDDLDARSVAFMPRVQALLAARGTTFSHFYVTDSLCCPSRSSILRGQYLHNHGVLSNQPPSGGFPQFYALGNEASTVGTWLHAAGYHTALLGKYLNDYPNSVPRNHVPPGWDRWASPVDNSGYNGFLYVLNENGSLFSFGRQPTDYFTDVLSSKAGAFVQDALGLGQPFFLYLATYAPHQPATPAPRDKGTFAGAIAPRTPSFNELDVSDKPNYVRTLGLLTRGQIAELDNLYRRRLESLQAVDDMVGSIVDTLTSAGQLGNTYIFFSSDNGFHLGQHRMQEGKQTPYEEDVHVPMIVRGPGVPAGRVVDHLSVEIDLAPTFAELAGAALPAFVDGRSLVPLLREPAPDPSDWRQCLLLEHHAGSSEPFEIGLQRARQIVSVPGYKGLRCRGHAYVEYETGERELYDLAQDPNQLVNIYPRVPAALAAQQSDRLAELVSCQGAGCRAAEDASPPRWTVRINGPMRASASGAGRGAQSISERSDGVTARE
jgi:arylsulfatase A-like enzyme